MGENIVVAMTMVSIALIAGMTLNGIVDKVMRGKRLRYEAEAGTRSQDVRDIAERQQMIEDRLQVLERIATDRSTMLADEIETLRRDTRALAAGQHWNEDAL